MSNEELVKAIQNGDKSAPETLYNQNKGIINIAAKKFWGKAEAEDLKQQAFIIMLNAVNDYQEGQGASFATFFFQALLWGFSRYIYYAENDRRLPLPMMSLFWKHRHFETDFVQATGREPTREEVRFFLRLTDKEMQMLDYALASKSITSLSIEIGEDGAATMEDLIPDNSDHYEEAEERIDREKDAATIRKAVDRLPEREAAMIKERYFDNMSPSDMAQKNHVSVQRVHQIIERGKTHLRWDGTLCRIAKDRGLSSGSYRGSLSSFEQTGFSSVEREVFRKFGLSAKMG